MANLISAAHSLKAHVERTLGWLCIARDFYAASDETTTRLKAALRTTPWSIYPGSTTESGHRFYSSLKYPSPEAARDAFARASHSLVYGRDGTPDGDSLINALLQLDPAARVGRVTGHGMAAIEAALQGMKSGEHLVASKHIFGTSKKNFEDLPAERGIAVTFVDGRRPEEWEAAIRPGKTRMFLFEPVGNPGMERADTGAIAAIGHKEGRDILVVSDNSMTPLDQSLSKGADIVAFSTTKLLGMGIDNGGGVFLSQSGLDRLMRLFPNSPIGYPVLTRVSRKGLTQSHRASRAMLKQVAMSAVRMRRQTQTAGVLARALAAGGSAAKIHSVVLDPQASASEYSQVFAMDLGSQEKAFQFIQTLSHLGVGIVNNFGSARTTVIHPGTTTQSSLSTEEQREQGISPGLVRVSVGAERPSYLLSVFHRALRTAKL